MFRVYLLNNTVVVKSVDGRNTMFGQVLPDRETAILTYRYITEELESSNSLCPESTILN